MALPIVLSVTGVTAVTNSIVASQSPGAGAITINGSLATGGVATLTAPARVTVHSGGNDNAITFTVVGTNRNGNPQSETVAGTNAATATTTQDFATVTSITHTGSVAGTLIAGNSNVMSSRWGFVDYHNNPVAFGIGRVVTGTVTCMVEYTYDDPNTLAAGTFPTVWPVSLANNNANIDTQLPGFPCVAMRVTINSGTGTVKTTIIQSGLAGH